MTTERDSIVTTGARVASIVSLFLSLLTAFCEAFLFFARRASVDYFLSRSGHQATMTSTATPSTLSLSYRPSILQWGVGNKGE